MPEMTFTVRWPDGTVVDCYSPSLVMHDFLAVGDVLPVTTFVARTSLALDLASERVREKYGFECTSAMQQKADILQAAGAYDPSTPVEVVAMTPGLGG
jgi:uncharacterized repeat protein (TIGR04042 family)